MRSAKAPSLQDPFESDARSQYQRTVQFLAESVEKRLRWVAGATLFVVLFTAFSHFFYLPTYEAKSVVRVQTDQQVNIPLLLAAQGMGGYQPESREIARYLRYMGSESFVLAVAQNIKFNSEIPVSQLDLTDPRKVSYFSWGYWNRYFSKADSKKGIEKENDFNQALGSREIADRIAALVKMETDGVDLITVTAKTLDPRAAVVITNAYATEFAKLNLEKDSAEVIEAEKYIREKMANLSKQMRENELKMISIKERHHLSALDGNSAQATSELKDLERRLSDIQVQQSENLSLIKKFEAEGPTMGVEGMSSEEVHRFRIQELKRKNEELENQKRSLKMMAEAAEQKFSHLPKAEQEYQRLKRQEQLDYDVYSSLVQRMSQVELQKYSIFKKVSVDQLAKQASPSTRVSFVLKILFSLFASLFMSVLVTVLIEWLDPSVKSGEDFDSAGIEKIGLVPKITGNDAISKLAKDRGEAAGEEKNMTRMLVTRSNPKSIESMSFKYIRARLQKQKDQNGNPAQTVLITSATSGDGKSFIASNLAISFAQLGKKTLLIDCDFRHPSINRYFGIPNRKGLASVLKMEHTLDEVTVVDPVVPTLHILPADWGVEDPTEMLSDERLLILLDHLKSEYDYVIIDSPPIQMVVDGLILSSVVSSVVVVGRYRKTLKTLLTKTYHDLINVSFQKVYGVLNDAEQSRLLKWFGHHSHHYGYGYGYGAHKYYSSESAPSQGSSHGSSQAHSQRKKNRAA